MVRLTKRSVKLGNIPQPELPEDLDSWTAYRSHKQFRAPNAGDKLIWKELHSDDKGDDLSFPNEEQLPFLHWNSLWNGAVIVQSRMRCYAAEMEDGVLVSCWKFDQGKSRLLREVSFKEGLHASIDSELQLGNSKTMKNQTSTPPRSVRKSSHVMELSKIRKCQ